MRFAITFISEPSVRMRSIEKSTSSALKALPLWNLTPLRRVKRHTVGSTFSQEVARAGCSFRSGVRVTRSEEHTSELQSLMRISYAVFCLKKKNKRHETEKTSE